MRYNILFSLEFTKEFKKLDKPIRKQITSWIENNLVNNNDSPRFNGKPLKGNLKGYWRYRIGDYRLIVEINDEELVIIAISIGHRKDIYRK